MRQPVVPIDFAGNRFGSAQYDVRELLRLASNTFFPEFLQDVPPSRLQGLQDTVSKPSSQRRPVQSGLKSGGPLQTFPNAQAPRRPAEAAAAPAAGPVSGRPAGRGKGGVGVPETSTAASGSGTRYEPYISLRQALAGLASGQYKSGVLRVSKGRSDDAYITNEIADAPDYLIQGRQHRNRALHRDTVVFEVLPSSKWVRISDPYSQLKTESSAQDVRDEALAEPSLDKPTVQMRPTVRVVHVLEFDGKDRPYIAVLRENQSQAAASASGPGGVSSVLTQSANHFPVRAGDRYVKAIPLDTRIPWILIPIQRVSEWIHVPGTVDTDLLFRVQITSWDSHNALPTGQIVGVAGRLSDFDMSEKVALIDNGLEEHMHEFSEDVEAEAEALVRDYPKTFPAEVAKRRDFRNCGLRVLTIDPKTARDLDDAIHIRVDHSGETPEFEIGVHIADVTHFVPPSSSIDQEARKRCTTVYLSRRNFPMLPRSLCDNLCSLTPHEDKLTYSVVFSLSAMGTLSTRRPPWFGRSIIRTTARFNYDEIQTALDAFHSVNDHPAEEQKRQPAGADQIFSVMAAARPDQCPPEIWQDVWSDLVILESLTQQVRAKRFEAGSLQLHRAQFYVDVDELFSAADKVPSVVKAQMYQAMVDQEEDEAPSSIRETSHHLVEELMLLANRLVAEKIFHSSIGEYSVLRYHPSPKLAGLQSLERFLREVGIPSNFSSVSSIFGFLQSIEQSKGKLVENAIESLFMKSMYPAQYAVASLCPNFHHFALNFPFYTHFTSPIRRYADVMVHRLLTCALAVERAEGSQSFSVPAFLDAALPKRIDGPRQVDPAVHQRALQVIASQGYYLDTEELLAQCDLCNKKRLQARAASEECSIYFFCNWLHEHSKVYPTLATVLVCQDKSISVYISSLGTCQRLYYNNCQTSGANGGESNNIQKVSSSIADTLVLPVSITVKNKHTVEIVWSGPKSNGTGAGTNGAVYDAAAQLAYGGSGKKRVRQVIRTLGPVPVYLVPLVTVPRSFATFAIPPWSSDYMSIVRESDFLTREQKKLYQQAYTKGLESGYFDLGGCAPKPCSPEELQGQTIETHTVDFTETEVTQEVLPVNRAAGTVPKQSVSRHSGLSQQKTTHRGPRARRTATYKEGLQATARIIEFNTTQRSDKKESRRPVVKNRK